MNNVLLERNGSIGNNKVFSFPTNFNATMYDAGQKYTIKNEAQPGAPGFVYGSSNSSVTVDETKHSFVIVCSPVIISGGSSSSEDPSYTTTVKEKDKNGWILINPEKEDWVYYIDSSKTQLKRGWHKDGQDGRWYYLDLDTGYMFKGWHFINGKWYFFTPDTTEWTWAKGSDGEWYYKKLPGIKPLGSMYADENTPDGHSVSKDGDRISK